MKIKKLLHNVDRFCICHDKLCTYIVLATITATVFLSAIIVVELQ